MDEEILKWMADYCNGVLNEEDASHLQAWLQEDAGNRVLFERQLALHHEVRTLYFLEHSDPEKAWQKMEWHFYNPSKTRILLRRWAVAASLVLLIGSAVLFGLKEDKEMPTRYYSEIISPGAPKATLFMADGKSMSLEEGESLNFHEKDGTSLHTIEGKTLVYEAAPRVEEQVFHTIKVPVSGEYNLQLADGTRVWLNAASELRYPTVFSGDRREVFIEGEAFFQVAKDTRHPFVVHAANAQVKVLGTEFNISAYPEDSQVIATLNQGRIELSSGTEKVELVPDCQAILQKDQGSITVHRVDASLYSAWKHGVFEFENLSLERIAVQLARWYGVKFVFTDESLAERYFTGGVKKYNSLRESLNYIEHTTNVHFEIVNTNVFVTSR